MKKNPEKNKKSKSYKKIDQIKVYIWNQYVGAVALDPKLNYYVFAYDKKFGKSGIELSPLQMPLNDQEQGFVFTDLPEPTYNRLPAMLADALPDDFGNALIDQYMASHGIFKSQITPLDRLAYMGQRSMGALEFKPLHGPKNYKSSAIEMGTLVTEARSLIQGHLEVSDKKSRSASKSLRNIIDVGTSAGGARAKAVIAWNPKTNEIRSGQVDSPDGFEQWLLKLDGLSKYTGKDKEFGSSEDYGRIEFAYSLMAKSAGVKMTDCKLLNENGRSHFMTQRFDRDHNTKHHIQTLCGINRIDFKRKSTNSYEQLFMTLISLKLNHAAFIETFRRMVFNIMAKNCDDHSKNFSFILKQGLAWDLAPAYDLTFAFDTKNEWINQHLMSVNGKFSNFKIDDLITLADRFGIGEYKNIIKDVELALQDWPEFAKKAGLNKKVLELIRKEFFILK